MTEHTFPTGLGTIHYFISHPPVRSRFSLVFLPGLTADHRLFEPQINYFKDRCSLLVWDAPGHAASRPFALTFSLMDKARWLEEILIRENITEPVLIGQSMGGYVAQMYCQLFPQRPKGFVSIDSAPLQRKFVTAAELWLLKRMEPVYRLYPWKWLLDSGTKGVSTTDYGRALMRDMMMAYAQDQNGYAALAGHGYRMLAAAMEAGLPCHIPCPALLICGEKDHAGSCIRYNKAWHRDSGIPLTWIPGAGHNANTDAPDTVNRLIEGLVDSLFASIPPHPAEESR